MPTFTVTSTSASAADPGSYPNVAGQAANSPGATIAFALPAGSTIALTGVLPNPTVAQVYDFTGAPGLTITSAGGTAYSVIRDYVSADIYGGVSFGAASGAGLLIATPTASATLHTGGALLGASTGASTVNDYGQSLTLQPGSTVTATDRNAIYLGGSGAAGQTIFIGSGATVSNTGASQSAVFVDTSTLGALVSNAGAISATGNAAYVGNADSALTNTSTGRVATSTTFAAVQLNATATVANAGQIVNTSTGSALLNNSTGSGSNNSGQITSAGTAYVGNAGSAFTNLVGATISTSSSLNVAAAQINGTARLDNAGSINNSSTGVSGIGVYASGAGVLTNSGTISTTATSGYAVGLQSGASLTSTGVIAARSATSYAVDSFGSTGLTAITLGAGSNTTGAVGGTAGASLAITVAGALDGNIVGGAEADTVRLVNGLSFSRVITLGGGGDVLTLDGASGSSTLAGGNVVSSVALVKAGAGTWVLTGAGVNYTGVAFNAGVLELGAANSAGSGAITFGSGLQTLQLDTMAGTNFALTAALSGFGAEDRIDIHNSAVVSAAAVGDVLTLSLASGNTATLTFTPGQLTGRAVVVSSDGMGGSLISLSTPAGYTPPPSTPVQTASQQAGYTTQTDNLLRASPNDPALTDPSSPIFAQSQAGQAIANNLDQGRISAADAQSQLLHLVDGTTSVAEISYAFFTGRTPTAQGLNYLVHSAANPTDLNDAYYQRFTTENRYINFGVNLATGSGAGAASFQAAYGALSLQDATAKAYQAVFGTTPTADKVTAILTEQVSNGLGGTETRAQYLADITGGSALAQKAAVVGFLLADSVKEGFGTYQQADLHFLQDLAHGTAAFNVDLLAAYAQAPNLVGHAVSDPTLGG